MTKRKGPLIWVADHPSAVLMFGVISVSVLLLVSIITGAWHWFPRGGALLALSGFIVSVRDAILYLAPQPPVYEHSHGSIGFEGLVRHDLKGLPVMHPDIGVKLHFGNPYDQDFLDEDYETKRREALEAWEEAADFKPTLVKESSEGRPMRELSELTDKEYSQLRLSAIFGVLGTLIWAFGDLAGGIPS